MSGRPYLWTPQRREQLRLLVVDEKMTSGEVAKQLGTTAGAVRGQMFHMGLKAQHGISFGSPESQALSPKRRAKDREPQPVKRKPGRPQSETASPPPADDTIASNRLKRREAEYSGYKWNCQYVAGDPRQGAEMCGHPREFGQPWCSDHCGTCYTNHRGSGQHFVLTGGANSKAAPKPSAMAIRSGRVSSQMGAGE